MDDGINAYVYGPANFGGGTAPLIQIPLSGTTSTPSYLFSDPNGVRSVMTQINDVTFATQAFAYSAYGQRNPDGVPSGAPPGWVPVQTPFGFQGGYTDPTGFIYFINRYYDPATGQF